MQIQKQSFFSATLMLLISNIIVKGLGFVYRIFLVRYLGTEAMGLIEIVSPAYSFFLVLAGWGVSLGVSTKIAERSANEDWASCSKYIYAAKYLLKLFGIGITVIAVLSLPLVLHFIADKRSIWALTVLLPAIPIVTCASAYRGIFQGLRMVSQLGNAQIVEQLSRVIIGTALTFLLLERVIEMRIAAISLATLTGEIFGMLYIRRRYKKINGIFINNAYQAKEDKTIYRKELLSFGTPVTLTRLSSSLIAMLQAIILPLALQKSGLDTNAATAAYGALMSVALSLLHLPGIFTSALTVSVVPAIAESCENTLLIQQRINKALSATVIFTLPGMLCLFCFAEPLCNLLFHTTQSADALRILSAGGIFLYVQVTLSCVLQGMGQVKELLKNIIITGVILLLTLYFFTSKAGICGTAWALNIDFILTLLLNCLSIRKKVRIKHDWANIMLKPMAALSIAITFMLVFQNKIIAATNGTASLLTAMLFACIIYFIAVFALNGFRLEYKIK